MAMRRKDQDDVLGDIVDEETSNLPGGFGVFNPDASIEATANEITEDDVRGPLGEVIAAKDERGGITAGTSYAEAVNEGSTVDPAALRQPGDGDDDVDRYLESEAPQQRRNQSVESEGPFGDQ